MIQRQAQNKLIQLAQNFKAIALVGPRQSGKTTLAKATFPDKTYISLENLDDRQFALEDPRAFLGNLPNGAILDEIQRVPALFSYLQEILDNSNEKGLFILTGSNNFLLQENIVQSLAGRIGFLSLLPFSVDELQTADLLSASDDELMFTGFYPPIYDQNIPPVDWLPNYIKTYIERDVRLIKNISNLFVFEKFMRIIAGRTGQELNLSSISVEVGVDVKTIQSWMGILESSFIVFKLKPHHKNFKKTIVKRPKIYFYDVGIVCSLLRIKEVEQIRNYPLRGAIFETMVVADLMKNYLNKGVEPPVFFWRDKTGHEIDVIIDHGDKMIPIEIKSGQTVTSDWFKNLKYWQNLSQQNDAVVLYGGKQMQKRTDLTVVNWRAWGDV